MERYGVRGPDLDSYSTERKEVAGDELLCRELRQASSPSSHPRRHHLRPSTPNQANENASSDLSPANRSPATINPPPPIHSDSTTARNRNLSSRPSFPIPATSKMSSSSLSPFRPRLFITLLLLLLHPPITNPPTTAHAQQVGSFFTAIQYNNGALPASHSACDSMPGGSGYCCASGQSCAWDDGGSVACCPSGGNCQGTAGGAGQYQQQGCDGGCCNNGGCGGGCGYNNCPQQDTATVYQQPQTTDYNGGGAVVPIVPINSATLLSPTPTYHNYDNQLPATTTVPPQTVVAGGVVGGGDVRVTTTVGVGAACGGGGYTTLTKANVGAAVTTVGCYIIFEAGASGRWGGGGLGGGWGWMWVWVGAMVGLGGLLGG